MNKGLTISCVCVGFVFLVAIALFIYLLVTNNENFIVNKTKSVSDPTELDDIAELDPRFRGRRI